MADQILLYISAAPDLRVERDLLGRSVAEMPVELAWRVVQSPLGSQPIDQGAVVQADVHLLLMGGDIRAPIGQEWLIARRAGRQPVLFLKENITRTPAAQDFVRYIENQATWRTFREGGELRRQVEILMAEHLLNRIAYFSLSSGEIDRLRNWLSALETGKAPEEQPGSGGAGDSGLIFSTERYVPSDGVLLEPGAGTEEEQGDRPEIDAGPGGRQ